MCCVLLNFHVDVKLALGTGGVACGDAYGVCSRMEEANILQDSATARVQLTSLCQCRSSEAFLSPRLTLFAEPILLSISCVTVFNI